MKQVSEKMKQLWIKLLLPRVIVTLKMKYKAIKMTTIQIQTLWKKTAETLIFQKSNYLHCYPLQNPWQGKRKRRENY